ncbi:hypothetical protein [Micromonospora sp. NPDC004704]
MPPTSISPTPPPGEPGPHYRVTFDDTGTATESHGPLTLPAPADRAALRDAIAAHVIQGLPDALVDEYGDTLMVVMVGDPPVSADITAATAYLGSASITLVEPAPEYVAFTVTGSVLRTKADRYRPVVDAVAAALGIGPAKAMRAGSLWYHQADGQQGALHLSTYTGLPAPKDTELEVARLRAELAALRAERTGSDA